MDIEIVLLKNKASIKYVGWLLLGLSIFFFLNNKSANPKYWAEFWIFFGAVNLGTLVWLSLAILKPNIRSKTLVSVFTPYIAGSLVWLTTLSVLLILANT